MIFFFARWLFLIGNITISNGNRVWTDTKYFTCCLLLTKSNRKLQDRVHLFLSSVIVEYVRVKTFHMYHNNALKRNCCLVRSLKLDVSENRIEYFWKHSLCISVFLVTTRSTNISIQMLFNNIQFLRNSPEIISSLSNHNLYNIVIGVEVFQNKYF